MKKFILSTIILGSFGFYVVWQNMSKPSDSFVTSTPVVSSNNTKKTSSIVSIVSNNSKSNTIPVSTPTPIAVPPKDNGIYKDGEYTGSVADAYYGNVQVKVIISGGKIVDVQFLDYPHNARNSIRISTMAMPILKQETITAQSANVNAVSGASHTSPAFIESLTSALDQAKV